jgi:hypothetical protein
MSEANEHCPNISRCELFARLRTDSTLQFCLGQYCHAEYTTCARYRHVQDTKTKPASDLLPNGKRLAHVRESND